MFIRNIKIDSFRNLDVSILKCSSGINVIYGLNGSGKTNLLESLFTLLLARSPRGAADFIMVKDGSDFYRMEGEIEIEGKKHDVAVAYQKSGRKKVTFDGVTIRISELFENCTAVSASPGDTEILAGSPSQRRDFINIYLSQASKRYLSDLTDYQKVLAQKNAFLRQAANGTETPYDDLLIKYGSLIMLARNDFLAELAEFTKRHYVKISGGQLLEAVYKPSVPVENGSWDLNFIEEAFSAKLMRYREREVILQSAVVGPHRDELEFFIRGYPARTHGSQGELRSAAISLKLAVFEYLMQKRKTMPVLLLDEIFAELDHGRKNMLVELFDRFGQIFLTTASEIPESLGRKAKKFEIVNGAVKEE